MNTDTAVQILGEILGKMLGSISEILGEDYKLTLVARYTGPDADKLEADIVIGNDDSNDMVVAAIKRSEQYDTVTVETSVKYTVEDL